MTRVTTTEAAANFPDLLSRVEAGEQIEILRDGRAVATIQSTAATGRSPEAGLGLAQRVNTLRARLREAGELVDLDEILRLRDEGRR